MMKRMIVAISGLLILLAIASAGWYTSGRDYRTIRDGLSVRFRDRGTVVFNTMKRVVEEDEDEASRQLAFKDAKRALAEASRSVKTKNDSKVHAILNSYYQFYYLPFEQMHLLKKEQELDASQLDLAKQLAASNQKADRDLASATLADTLTRFKTGTASLEQLMSELPSFANNGRNCEVAAAQYFADPPATIPSEGLDHLCNLVPDEKRIHENPALQKTP